LIVSLKTYTKFTQLNIVFESLVINSIKYAIPAWGGFITTELRSTINGVFREPLDVTFVINSPSAEQIMEFAHFRHSRRFTAIQHPGHGINSILHDIKACCADLPTHIDVKNMIFALCFLLF